MTEFRIPLRPEDLQTQPSNFSLALSPDHDVRFSNDLAERVIHDLGFNEPACILEQSQFDAVYIVVKEFGSMSVDLQSSLLEALNSTIKILATVERPSDDQEAVMHRSAIKVYVFFVNWLWNKAESVQPPPQQGVTPRRRNSQSRRQRSRSAVFDWKGQMEGTMSALSGLLSVDLTSIFHPAEIDHRMLDLCLSLAVRCLESWDLLKCAKMKDHIYNIFSSCAVKHQIAAETASSLFTIAQKTEQLPSLVAEIVQFSEQAHEDDALTCAIVQEITKASPHDYSSQWEASRGRSLAIKCTAKLIEHLGSAVPLSLLKQSSALEPYWSCTAYPIRSALVSALGELILALMAPDAPNREHHHQQHHQMLDRLILRFADVNAFTRSRCVMVWVQLTQKRCVPIAYWLDVTRLASERLRDNASTVRKSSLCLLQALIEYNPFGANIHTDRFRATLTLYKKRLEESSPQQRENENGEEMLPEPPQRPSLAEGADYHQLCFVVQNLEKAVRFTEYLTQTLTECKALLACPSITVTQEVVHYLAVCKKFSVSEIGTAMKAALALVFSREQTLRDEILATFVKLYTDEEDDLVTAQNLVLLTVGATVGEMTCIEEIVKTLLLQEKIPTKVVKALILIALDRDTMPVAVPDRAKIKGAVSLLSVCAPHCQDMIAENLDSVLQIGFVDGLTDGSCVGQICHVLKSVNADYFDDDAVKDISCSLVQILFEEHMPNSEWFEVAESAVGTLYALFPSPDELFEEILQEMASKVHQAPMNEDLMEDDAPGIRANAFLRFCFLLGQVALHHMVYIEICADVMRSKLLEPEGSTQDNDDVMGGIVNRQDMELDGLKSAVQKEILNPNSLIGHYALMISSFCHSIGQFVEAPIPVQISLSFALVKLMTIDLVFCQNNIRLLFTLLKNEKVDSVIKGTLIIHLSDLIIRFPNLMEPWTSNIYDLLSSKTAELRRNALLVLTHLILSDMIKVKGHISKIMLLMRDDDERLRTMAMNFVSELARKATRSYNPIYNHFPDVLSNLLQEKSLPSQDFQAVIQYLLKHTNEKHGEKLVEKLCLRFESEDRVKVWRGLSFSIKCLQLGEKGFRRFMEMIKYYRASLADEQSFRNLKEACNKLKRNCKSNELKSLVQLYETDLASVHEELKDVAMETESEPTEDDALEEQSELTLAAMGGNEGSTVSSATEISGSVRSSVRKRKAQQQDTLERRSEVRLTTNDDRLNRISERSRSLESSEVTSQRAPDGGMEDQGSSKKLSSSRRGRENSRLPQTPVRRKTMPALTEERRDSVGSPEMERRLSRLSLSQATMDT